MLGISTLTPEVEKEEEKAMWVVLEGAQNGVCEVGMKHSPIAAVGLII